MGKSVRRGFVRLEPRWLAEFTNEEGLWHENREAVRAGLRWGRRKCALLAWVHATMAARLTDRERHCIALYFFEGCSFAEAGERTGTHASSVLRAVQRGLRKLRSAAQEEPVWRRLYALGGKRPPRRNHSDGGEERLLRALKQ